MNAHHCVHQLASSSCAAPSLRRFKTCHAGTRTTETSSSPPAVPRNPHADLIEEAALDQVACCALESHAPARCDNHSSSQTLPFSSPHPPRHTHTSSSR